MELSIRGRLRAGIGIVAILALSACKSRVDHTADVTALVQAPAAPDDAPSGFVPVADKERAPIPPPEPKPYRIGVGDVLKVRILVSTGQPMAEGDLVAPVKEDGTVSLPVAKTFEVKDKTVLEVEAILAERLKSFVNEPVVNVEVAEFRARHCRIVGLGVDQEQILPVDGKLTLLGALIKSGATRNKLADRDEAYIIRASKVHPFSIDAIIGAGDPAGDCVLEEGDHVVVPALSERQDYVYVLGQVMKPGRFEMENKVEPGKPGRLTLTGAIAMAGGLNEGTARCESICIFRGSWRDLHMYQVGARDIYQSGEAIALQPGDRIYVSPTQLARMNMGAKQFVEMISGAATPVTLGLSAAALWEWAK